MQMIAELKTLILDVLESAFQSGDVHATQQMGVNMSNSMKREGVVIIQNQNVEVYARIIPSMVKMLKLCDAMESSRRRQVEITLTSEQQLPPPTHNDAQDPIKACCAWLFENHVNWHDMQDLMKARYLEHVIGNFRTKADAARWLGVGSTYLSKLSKSATNF